MKKAPRKLLLDINVLIRYITNDDPKKADACERLFQEASEGRVALLITDVCLAELVWTLGSYYQLDRVKITDNIISILNTPGFVVQDENRWMDVLDRYGRTNVDFVDAYHAAAAYDQHIDICSYDRDYKIFKDIRRIEPE